MPTTKNRLNITLSKDVEEALKASAKAADVPRSTRAAELLKLALQIEEDVYFDEVANRRASKKGEMLSHEEFWEKALR